METANVASTIAAALSVIAAFAAAYTARMSLTLSRTVFREQISPDLIVDGLGAGKSDDGGARVFGKLTDDGGDGQYVRLKNVGTGAAHNIALTFSQDGCDLPSKKEDGTRRRRRRRFTPRLL